MKISTLILAASLAANAVVLGLIVAGSPDQAGLTASDSHPGTAGKKVAASSGPVQPGPEAWAGLQAGDLAEQRDRLRAAGFPPEIVRAILAAQVGESFAARRRAIEGAEGELPFWKNPVRDPKMQAALRDLYREQEKVMKDLLGREARSDDPAYVAYLHRQFGNLPDEKVDQLRQIQDDYNQKRSEFFMNSPGGVMGEDRKKLADLDRAMQADFAAVMTPEEFTEYNLRSSNTAQQLRYALAAFDASEPEYRAIFQLQQAFDDKYGRMYGPSSPDEMRARMEAQKQLTEDIKAALGPDRATDYERATDFRYRQATQLVARLELPPETATSLWNTQKEFEQRRSDLFAAGSTAPIAERMQQLTALQQEAIARITPLLGGDASRLEIYKQNGGQWLQNFTPRPALPLPRN